MVSFLIWLAQGTNDYSLCSISLSLSPSFHFCGELQSFSVHFRIWHTAWSRMAGTSDSCTSGGVTWRAGEIFPLQAPVEEFWGRLFIGLARVMCSSLNQSLCPGDGCYHWLKGDHIPRNIVRRQGMLWKDWEDRRGCWADKDKGHSKQQKSCLTVNH